MTRVDVRKTYKLYIGGAFPRSESGHSYVVDDAKGKFVANAALASRKDARDAVRRGPHGVRRLVRQDGLQPRADPLPRRRGHGGPAPAVRRGAAPVRGPHADPGRARSSTPRIDRLVWYAGWADKITQVIGNANPVAGPFFNLSTPEPTGVVAVLAPQESSLLAWSASSPRSIVTGNTVVVLARTSGRCPPSRSPRCWPPPTCPVAWSTSSPARSPTPRRGWPSHMDVNAHRPHRRRRRHRAGDRARGGRGREPQAGPPRPGHRARLDRRAGPRAG